MLFSKISDYDSGCNPSFASGYVLYIIDGSFGSINLYLVLKFRAETMSNNVLSCFNSDISLNYFKHTFHVFRKRLNPPSMNYILK